MTPTPTANNKVIDVDDYDPAVVQSSSERRPKRSQKHPVRYVEDEDLSETDLEKSSKRSKRKSTERKVAAASRYDHVEVAEQNAENGHKPVFRSIENDPGETMAMPVFGCKFVVSSA